MEYQTILATLAQGPQMQRRKALQDHLEARRKHQWNCQMELDAVAQEVTLTELKLAAIPEIKIPEYEEAKDQKPIVLARVCLRLNEAIFTQVAVGKEIWVRAKDSLKYAKATVTMLAYGIEMKGRLQCRFPTNSECEETTAFSAYPRNMDFRDIKFLPVTLQSLDETATKEFYLTLAAAVGHDSLCFL